MAKIQKTTEPTDYSELRRESRRMGEHNDCTVVAVSLATGAPYSEVHSLMKSFGRKDRCGTYTAISERAIKVLGFKIRKWSAQEKRKMINSYPGAHKNLKSITTHHMRRFPQAWAGCHPNMIMVSNGHMLALKSGIVQDWSINRALRVLEIWEVEKA